MKTIQQILRLLSSAKITTVCLLLMVVIIIWGTLFEASYGIYAARERFFQSWFFIAVSVVPFPGIRLISLVLFVNLALRSIVFFKSPLKNSGLLIIHAGIAFLMTGALFSSHYTREYVLPLSKGEVANRVFSQDEFELVLLSDISQASGNTIVKDSIAIRNIKKGAILSLASMNFRVDEVKKNSMGKGIDNRRGNYRVSLISQEKCSFQNDSVIIVESYQPPVSILCDKQVFIIGIRPMSVALPLTITLLDFSKQLHQGTQTLKHVQSTVNISAKQENRNAIISLNKPLRNGTYTFYQASYSEHNGNERSNFSVVYNPFKAFPYIASFTILGGLLLHFVIMFFLRKRS